ncbi:RBBP9/YdeN family alpha/beta hydrolase [Cupriavidus necator]|uniref:RBBP9/YdeN family alpha/beta hydrolase n=1 Tax=Cupriavidus necator TaxID=106590 RepID=UPI0039C37E9E
MTEATVLMVPGLRDAVPQHWQTLLAARLPRVRSVAPMGRDGLDCAARVAAIEHEAQAVEGPLVIVAHSAGCIMVAHWALQTKRPVQGALLVTPPDLESPLPEGNPTIEALRAGGWLPVPRSRLPFRSIVGASRNDPLGSFERVAGLALDWDADLVDLGQVGHMNPASGHGDWPQAEAFVAQLSAARRHPQRTPDVASPQGDRTMAQASPSMNSAPSQ